MFSSTHPLEFLKKNLPEAKDSTFQFRAYVRAPKLEREIVALAGGVGFDEVREKEDDYNKTTLAFEHASLDGGLQQAVRNLREKCEKHGYYHDFEWGINVTRFSDGFDGLRTLACWDGLGNIGSYGISPQLGNLLRSLADSFPGKRFALFATGNGYHGYLNHILQGEESRKFWKILRNNSGLGDRYHYHQMPVDGGWMDCVETVGSCLRWSSAEGRSIPKLIWEATL